MKERTVITQELCRKAEIMLAVAKVPEVAKLLGIGESTLKRIRQHGFDAKAYKKALEDRKEEKSRPERKDLVPAEEQVPGQISMELPDGTGEKTEMSEQAKMMRFQAGQVDKLYMMMNRINDNLCQIMRMMRKE